MKMARIQKTYHKLEFSILLVILAASALTIAVLPSIALGQAEETQLKLDLPPPNVPQPQLFCGYCHVLTYPGVVKKGYELWKKADIESKIQQPFCACSLFRCNPNRKSDISV